MLIRCSKESQHPAEWIPGPPVEHQENEKDTTLTAIRVGGQNISVLFGLQLPLTVEPHTTLSNLINKVRGTYILLKKSSCVCYSLRRYVSSIYMYISAWISIWQYNITPLKFFHVSVSWWSFNGDWVTASLLTCPGLLSILTDLNNAVVWMVSYF